VGLSQLGAPVALVGVVGEDPEGARVLLRAARDGIDITAVVPRGRTALLVDIVDEQGSRRLLEDIPEESLVTVEDLEQAHAVLDKADTVSIQLQQPPATVLAAADAGRRRRARVVVDGAPDPGIHDELLAVVDVLRADAEEAQLLAGGPVTHVDDALALGRRLLAAGPGLIALAVTGVGDLLVWPDGSHLLPLSDARVVDPTGAGDAFTAGLIAGLRDGADERTAGRLASAAASSTVERLGGRPELRCLPPTR
jgi:ribokinase